MIAAVISLGGIGFLAAVILGFAAKKFAVEVDPREEEIAGNLPGANCGASMKARYLLQLTYQKCTE